MVNTVAYAVLALTIVLDVAGQVCFKLGLNRSAGSAGPRSFWRRVAGTPLIWAGVAAYAIDLGAWLFVLSRVPLSLAVPLASLSYCGIALAGRLLLGERLSPRRWAGTVLIALGAAIVSTTA
ncbi:EamA family transporter [Zavarzinia compransoris]|uniref:Transporter n=1 Tax=Zavarzinia compransoris TaxID=1264899 RepID=A0A317E8L7_9PROT|nr:EamA family transporter [Zavarzinia compransoris]PWR23061.1 transporter [Zavarzinia compransoris]TDP46394.1 putative membrane protein [Zavarzinia compransoris]